MNKRVFDRILKQLNELSIDTENNAEILLCYIFAELNIQYSSHASVLDGINSTGFNDAIHRYDLKNSLPEYVYAVRFTALCRSLIDYKLDRNYRTFLDFFTPRLIAQWDVLESEIASISVIDRLVLIYIVVNGTRELSLKFVDIGKPEINSIYVKYIFILKNLLKLDSELFFRIWQAVFYIPMPRLRNTVSKKLITTNPGFYC